MNNSCMDTFLGGTRNSSHSAVILKVCSCPEGLEIPNSTSASNSGTTSSCYPDAFSSTET